MTPLDLLWLFLIFSSLQPLIQQRILAARRTHALRTLERRRGSRAITLIHRQERTTWRMEYQVDRDLLARHFDSPGERANELARTLSDGRWTHDFPIDVQMAHSLGLKVSTELPDEVRELMQLYPQPRGRRPSVEYIPLPYDAPSERKQTRRSSRSARS